MITTRTTNELKEVAARALENYLEELFNEAMETYDTNRELLLLSFYFVGCESIKKGTFMIVNNEDLAYIVVPGIPFDVTKDWSFRNTERRWS